jgi:hypothetical protein
MSNDDIDNLLGWGLAVAAVYGAFVVLGLALVVIWLVGGALMFILLETAAYLQGLPNDAGPWLLVPWTVIVACALVGWWQYRRFRQQRSLRQASPAPDGSVPIPSVLLEAIQVVEDEERRYRGEL